jgi:GTP-binding protein
MEDRAETETRADVARRLAASGPTSYVVGSTDDPDWAEDDPDGGAGR